ncbi:transposase, partial [Acidomonas methanolica]
HAGGGGAKAGPPGKRFSAKRKLEAVQRLVRGESLDAVSRDMGAPAHRLSEWRDRALLAAEGALKEREHDARDEEIALLKAKVGELTMAGELLNAKIDRLEGGRPLAGRRSRR